MGYFPLFMKLADDRRIVIVGGGSVALAKLEALLPYADSLFVISEVFSPAMLELLRSESIPFEQTSYDIRHLQGAGLVIAATDKSSVNLQIFEDARALGVLVNVVDNPEFCDVIFPAVVRRGDVQIAISTAGISPVLARLLKQQIERILPWNFENLIAFAKQKRVVVKEALSTLRKRRLFWHSVLEGVVAEEVLEGNYKKAEMLFEQSLQEQVEAKTEAALYLIGAGPGNPDLLTIKAVRLLSRADVVLYDRLVAPQVMDMYARKEAEKICVGKTRDRHLKTQEDIGEMIRYYLQQGKVVVRLKGGDPAIFAHGAEEIAIARELDVPYQIVPGVTAAVGCAAAAGIPLTERGGAASVRFLTLYKESMGDAAYWEALRNAQKETLVFYMATQQRDALCAKLVETGFDPETPILAIEQGTTPQHREYEGTLANFHDLYGNHPFASPVLLIIGDVVRLRVQHGWKEAPQEHKAFFRPLAIEQAAA